MNIAYTICSANYLPFAKALADSFVEQNKNSQFIIALADSYRDFDPSFFEPHKVLPVSEMSTEDLEHMNRSYDIFELSCALKPFVAEYILKWNEQADAVFYFDSDILVFGSLAKAASLLQEHPLVITPHFSIVSSHENAVHFELNLLRTGLYNAGFFGVNKSPEAFRFLHWWKERLKQYCFNDTRSGLFVDQLWLNLAPVYFRDTCVLYDPGYNLAYWNFSERSLTIEEGRMMVNKVHPLVFFHFSGYDISQPGIISKFQRDLTLKNSQEYAPLFEKYREQALRNNSIDFFSLPVTMGRPRQQNRKKGFSSLVGKLKKLF